LELVGIARRQPWPSHRCCFGMVEWPLLSCAAGVGLSKEMAGGCGGWWVYQSNVSLNTKSRVTGRLPVSGIFLASLIADSMSSRIQIPVCDCDLLIDRMINRRKVVAVCCLTNETEKAAYAEF